jgi:hypothetical protein
MNINLTDFANKICPRTPAQLWFNCTHTPRQEAVHSTAAHMDFSVLQRIEVGIALLWKPYHVPLKWMIGAL